MPRRRGQQVAEAPGGDETGAGAAAGQHGVGGDGGAVDDGVHPGQEIPEFGPAVPRGLLQRVEYPQAGVRRRGRRLADARPAFLIADQQVGEGAAHVDADLVAHVLSVIP